MTQEQDTADKEAKCDLLIQLVGELRQNHRKRLNIVFVGTAGVGKSSVINSIATAVTEDKFREYAISGADAGTANQMTHRLQTIPGERYGRHNKEFFGGVQLPNLIDIAGFQNEDTAVNEELLRVVLYGRFVSGESFVEAQRYLKVNGILKFRRRYKNAKVNKENKIDRIVVVATATEPVPVSLIECIKKAAYNTKATAGNRAIPIFGLMTKIDNVNLHTEEFLDHENSYLEALQMTGNRLRYQRVSSYCHDVDSEEIRRSRCIARIDIPFLEFMIQVIKQTVNVLLGQLQIRNKNPDNIVLEEQLDPPARSGAPRSKDLLEEQVRCSGMVCSSSVEVLNADESYTSIPSTDWREILKCALFIFVAFIFVICLFLR